RTRATRAAPRCSSATAPATTRPPSSPTSCSRRGRSPRGAGATVWPSSPSRPWPTSGPRSSAIRRIGRLASVRVAVGSDERTPLTDAVVADLRGRGHDPRLVGPLAGTDAQWAEVGHDVGCLVAGGECETGVLFCFTGTGAAIAANKVAGVRAALCTDATTAGGARRWNDANVLVMSLRLTSLDVAREMLDAWFVTDPDPGEAANIERLERS